MESAVAGANDVSTNFWILTKFADLSCAKRQFGPRSSLVSTSELIISKEKPMGSQMPYPASLREAKKTKKVFERKTLEFFINCRLSAHACIVRDEFSIGWCRAG